MHMVCRGFVYTYFLSFCTSVLDSNIMSGHCGFITFKRSSSPSGLLVQYIKKHKQTSLPSTRHSGCPLSVPGPGSVRKWLPLCAFQLSAPPTAILCNRCQSSQVVG
ncbi:hypothetical protein XENOCAPTIV_018494 [Xenoophorus captivus]|uniref:Secreted protein n=1 Tax=Xenoophorus captivus TaxID=1517983 RepID=A0ABV0RAS9_9TELE